MIFAFNQALQSIWYLGSYMYTSLKTLALPSGMMKMTQWQALKLQFRRKKEFQRKSKLCFLESESWRTTILLKSVVSEMNTFSTFSTLKVRVPNIHNSRQKSVKLDYTMLLSVTTPTAGVSEDAVKKHKLSVPVPCKLPLSICKHNLHTLHNNIPAYGCNNTL